MATTQTTPSYLDPEPGPYAEAIQEIQNTAIRSAEPKVVQVEVDDGAGGKRTVPVLVLAGKNGQEPHTLLHVLREGGEFAKAERLAKADGPDRRQGTANHQALQSFIDHANRFKAQHSAVWADAARRQLVSVLDYHPAGADSAPRWGKHRGVYSCPLSESWQAWGGGKELKLDQEGFAALLDGRDRELASGKLPNGSTAPDPSTLISLATNLEVYSSANAKRERDPGTGKVKVSFSEEKGVVGAVLPPPSFLIGISVFQDAVPQALEVRLRVTVEGGHAAFHVQIHAAGDVLRFAFDDLCDQVRTATDLPLFIGTPEA